MGTDNLFKNRKARAEEQHTRSSKNLPPNQVILIVCEGEKTEKNYFETFKQQLHTPSVNISIDTKSDSAPSKVVERAKQKLAENPNEYDEIYCVFDRDIHKDFNKALKMAENANFKTIVSDPCFEYWILLHFEKTDKKFGQSGGSPCKDLIANRPFKDKVKNYTKDYDFTEIIQNNLPIAIKHAREINQQNEKIRQSPYTQVVYLVERLQELSNKIE